MRLFVLGVLLFSASPAAAESWQVIHQESFDATLSPSQIACHHLPAGFFNLEAILLRIDRDGFSAPAIPRNHHQPIYGMDNEFDLLAMNKDCSVMAELWSLAPLGTVPTTGILTVYEGVDTTWRNSFYCEQGIKVEVSFDVPVLGEKIVETYRMHMQNVGPASQCDQTVPLAENGSLFFHPQAWSERGLHCTAKGWPVKHHVAMQPSASNTAWPRKVTSVVGYEEADCLARVADLLMQSEADDPANNGQWFDAARTVYRGPDPLGAREIVRQDIKFTMYDEAFEGSDYVDVKHLPQATPDPTPFPPGPIPLPPLPSPAL